MSDIDFLLFQCTFRPSCLSSRVSNENSVIGYSHHYGTRAQTYECFYNPEYPSEIIRTRKFHIGYVIHGLVWPSVFVISNSMMLVLLVKNKKILILKSIYKP